MLEDLGYARVVPEEGGKKIYEITDEGTKTPGGAQHDGRRHLRADRPLRRGFHRCADDRVESRVFSGLVRATYKTATGHIRDKDKIEKLRDIIRRAADEIEAVAK